MLNVCLSVTTRGEKSDDFWSRVSALNNKSVGSITVTALIYIEKT